MNLSVGNCTLKKSIALVMLFVLLLIAVSCSANKEEPNYIEPYYEFLGDISYESPVAALVYESIDGEDEKGIVYREVTDLNKLSRQEDIAVCLYFYTSQSSDIYGVTAGVEDLAQGLTGQVLFIAIDAMSRNDIIRAYEVEALPEFILINKASRIATFEGFKYDYWEISDVETWLSDNGFDVNYDLLYTEG